MDRDVSKKSWLAILILCIFFGYLGIHRFYAGKYITGLIWLITVGLFGVGYIVDLLLIATFKFKDSKGKVIK
ncbi:MAG TPA: TM2 domain-containing protein [Haloplasmataceae bacterium]